MAKIVKTFRYDIADDYLAQTNNLGKQASWTYKGPDKIWVFVSKETLKLASNRWLTAEEDGETYPTPLDEIKVEIDCDKDPLLAAMFHAGQEEERTDYTKLPQYVEQLPCGGTYVRPLDPPPDHTYELLDLEYDLVKGEFKKPYPWKKPHVTWDDIRELRNRLLEDLDHRVYNDTPDSLKAKVEEYKQALRDWPQTYYGLDPWKVQPIPDPFEPRWKKNIS